ncbi:hypothetical protein FB451DRAFT_1190222 [Mycena latifolia]|nr:hypothetical protein FB451DRAFT_1190222 [Mycena latifolia]
MLDESKRKEVGDLIARLLTPIDIGRLLCFQRPSSNWFTMRGSSLRLITLRLGLKAPCPVFSACCPCLRPAGAEDDYIYRASALLASPPRLSRALIKTTGISYSAGPSVDTQKLNEQLGTIMRAKEGKMVKVSARTPFVMQRAPSAPSSHSSLYAAGPTDTQARERTGAAHEPPPARPHEDTRVRESVRRERYLSPRRITVFAFISHATCILGRTNRARHREASSSDRAGRLGLAALARTVQRHTRRARVPGLALERPRVGRIQTWYRGDGGCSIISEPAFYLMVRRVGALVDMRTRELPRAHQKKFLVPTYNYALHVDTTSSPVQLGQINAQMAGGQGTIRWLAKKYMADA